MRIKLPPVSKKGRGKYLSHPDPDTSSIIVYCSPICAINVSFIKDGVEMLNINMLDFVLNYPSKKTKKKKKGLEHEVFLRAFIQNTSQICE